MNEKRWYVIALEVLLAIVFLPIILFALAFGAVVTLVQLPKNRREYRRSAYFNDLHLPYRIGAVNSQEYRFYNSAKRCGLPIRYTVQSDGFEYFVYADTVYIFPDFEQLDTDESNSEWQVSCDGDWSDFQQHCEKLCSRIAEDADGMATSVWKSAWTPPAATVMSASSG